MAGYRKKVNGFTLIEVMIAMTLLGILVVLLFSSLRIAAQSWNSGENKVVQVNKKAVVYQFFKRHLSAVHPAQILTDLQVGEGGETARQVFQGMPHSLRFVGALPASSALKGLQVFEISADNYDTSTLVVALTPYLRSEQPPPPDRVVLLRHIKSFTFSYFGRLEVDGMAGWNENWSGSKLLPQLIKVSIRLEDGSDWPDMVFQLKINSPDNAADGSNNQQQLQ